MLRHLEKCLDYTNEIDVRNSVPSCEIWRNALYIPVDDNVAWEQDDNWGLYDADHNLVDAAAYYRGPGKNLIGQSAKTANAGRDAEVAPPGRYLYGGNLIGHYGHFLLSSLSRYWLGLFEDLSSFKIICHGAGTPHSWMSNAYMREIFEAVGLSTNNFIVFKRPTIVNEILVPRPAAEEHNYTHTAFADWGAAVGQALTRNFDLHQVDRPVWLAKTHLDTGVQGLDNEAELVEILEKEGVDIVHPQDLSLVEQVFLFKTRPLIMGTSSSAFHTKILGATAKLVCLNLWPQINSNYALIDSVSSDEITFLRPEISHNRVQNSRFMDSASIADPRAVADDFLTIANDPDVLG